MRNHVPILCGLAAGLISTGAVLYAHADANERPVYTATADQLSELNLIDPVVTGSVPGEAPATVQRQGRTLLELCNADCQAERLKKWTVETQ